MPLASRSTLTASVLTIAAVAAPFAHANPQRTAQGAPPILRSATPSELQSISRAEMPGLGSHATYGGVYSNAELNGYRVAAVTPPRSSSTSNGFDYGDAAVGAGITGGIVLLLGAGGLTVRRHRQLQHP